MEQILNKLLTVQEAAKYSGIHRETLYRFARAKAVLGKPLPNEELEKRIKESRLKHNSKSNP